MSQVRAPGTRAANIRNQHFRAEVRSTDRSSRWPFVQEVGHQTSVANATAQLKAVKDTSAPASSHRQQDSIGACNARADASSCLMWACPRGLVMAPRVLRSCRPESRAANALTTHVTPSERAGMQPLRGFGRDPQMRGSNRGCITLTARGESILATT